MKTIFRLLYSITFLAIVTPISARTSVYQGIEHGPVKYDEEKPTEEHGVAPSMFFSYTPALLKNGYYPARVFYHSHTGKESLYRLVVVVEDDCVVAIYFDEDEYIHVGQNNSGYRWSGGALRLVTTSDGAVEVVAEVKISHSQSSPSYSYGWGGGTYTTEVTDTYLVVLGDE